MVRLSWILLLAAAFLIGCGSSEESKPANVAAEKAAIAESTAAWTPDKVNEFNKAHNEDGRLTPGQKLGKTGMPGQAEK